MVVEEFDVKADALGGRKLLEKLQHLLVRGGEVGEAEAATLAAHVEAHAEVSARRLFLPVNLHHR